jgi:hypothetical protein
MKWLAALTVVANCGWLHTGREGTHPPAVQAANDPLVVYWFELGARVTVRRGELLPSSHPPEFELGETSYTGALI